MQNELLQQGVSLMVFGMGTVFVFLAVLVLVTLSMSAIVKRIVPAVELQSVSSSPVQPVSQPQAIDAKRMAVIKAAIQQHRANL